MTYTTLFYDVQRGMVIEILKGEGGLSYNIGSIVIIDTLSYKIDKIEKVYNIRDKKIVYIIYLEETRLENKFKQDLAEEIRLNIL